MSDKLTHDQMNDLRRLDLLLQSAAELAFRIRRPLPGISEKTLALEAMVVFFLHHSEELSEAEMPDKEKATFSSAIVDEIDITGSKPR